MELLITNLVDLCASTFGVVQALVLLVGPWAALGAWVAYWLIAVDWKKLYPVLIEQGGIIGVLLMAGVMILVWGVISPPSAGRHFLFGLSVGNFVGKTVYVTLLMVIAGLCGSYQLAGGVEPLLYFPQPPVDEPHGHGGHGDHGSHDNHSHDAH